MCVSGEDIWHLDCDRVEPNLRAGELAYIIPGSFREIDIYLPSLVSHFNGLGNYYYTSMAGITSS